jgi:hypothetical protein
MSISCARAAAKASVSQGSMGARPGTKRARVSLARSFVPITKQASLESTSRAADAMASTRRIASGVSTMAQTRVRSGAPSRRSLMPTAERSSGEDTFGMRMASGPAAAAAARSPSPQGVSSALMRMTSSRLP